MSLAPSEIFISDSYCSNNSLNFSRSCSFVDWGNLAKYVGGDNLTRGGKLKETGTGHWIAPNYAATNEVGFTALPGGFYDGAHLFIGGIGYWWTSDPIPGGSFAEYVCLINTTGSFLNAGYKVKENYFSVRCIKDNLP